MTSTFDPTTGLETGPEMWEIDNANVPAPTMGAGEGVIQPGSCRCAPSSKTIPASS
ncbi:MAG: hypothetical protein WDN31_19075 [Hyphomicrobium sp.]